MSKKSKKRRRKKSSSSSEEDEKVSREQDGKRKKAVKSHERSDGAHVTVFRKLILILFSCTSFIHLIVMIFWMISHCSFFCSST